LLLHEYCLISGLLHDETSPLSFIGKQFDERPSKALTAFPAHGQKNITPGFDRRRRPAAAPTTSGY